MEKLSIEEKAKAYDEALERAKKVFNCEANDREPGTSICEYIFPVLKESEDEKIRKFLIKWIQDNYYHGTTEIPTKTLIAWLEKQKTIDVLDKEEKEFADNVDSYRKDMDEFYKKGYNAGREAEKQYWLEKQGQKLAWSEEDEHRVKDTIYFLDTAKKHYASTVELDACINWLKSLKERIGGE